MRRTIAFLFIALTALAANAADKVVHQTARLDANGRLAVETHNGSITVTTWNRPEVDIQARIEDALNVTQSDVKATQIRVTGSGSSVSVETDYTGISGWGLFNFDHDLPPVHYTISMPANARLKVTAHNASAKVRGLRNDVEVDTHNGPVDIADLDGAAHVETHNGEVRVAFARFAKPASIETHNGSIEVQMPQNSAFRIDADGHHLSFESDFPATVHDREASRFTGEVNGGGPALRISTHNGSVRLRKS